MSAPEILHFNESVAYEIATGVRPPAEVASSYDLTIEQLDELLLDPIFRKAVEAYKDVIQEKGVTVQLRAQIYLEHTLKVCYEIARDPTVDADTRLRAIDKLAMLSGDKNAQAALNPGGAPVVQMFLGGEGPEKLAAPVIEAGDIRMELDGG